MSSAAPKLTTLGLAWKPILAAVVLIALVWTLRQPALLFFGAVLVAATLHALAEPMARLTGLSLRSGLWIVIVLFPAVLAALVWWMGEPLAAQLQSLSMDLPRAWAALRDWLGQTPLGARVLTLVNQLAAGPIPWSRIAGFAGSALGALSAVVLLLLMGIYLAFDVGLYKRGLVRLFPVRHRAAVEEALDESGQSLTRWLLGQGVTMLLVGGVAATGLALLGMPLALALGVIAGLFEFVPFFGPIASGLLAVLVAFVQGPQQALYVALLFTAVQQIEGNVLVPMIQRWAVKLPPVLGVAAVIVFGSLFGMPGVIFGTPLMVVAMVLVRRLYVERTLEGTPS